MPSFIGPVTYPAASIPPDPPGRLQDFNGDGFYDYATLSQGSVTSPGGRRLDRRRDLGFGRVHAVEEGRAFDPLAAAAERDLHEAMDVGLLRFDLLAEVGHHAAQFRDHGFRVGQLLAKVVGVVGRRHAGFNTAPRSG